MRARAAAGARREPPTRHEHTARGPCAAAPHTRADFSSKYEDIILRVQLQEQLKTTKRYNMTVTEVLKSVDIKQSETQATIMRINAEAAAESRVVVNRAQMDALILEQTTKAIAYRRLKEHLGWSTSQFLEYVKLRSLNAQPSENIIVGTSPLGGAAVSVSE